MEGGLALKKSKFTEQQIAFALKQAETGTKVKEIAGTGESWFRYAGSQQWSWQRDFFDAGNAGASSS
jgi:hypothetical protein